ncbi:porin [Carboxylicivirga sediminis]|uniref:Porin n=1 Tax=Carboxylicivirga sediminis TaxID=2006564 RepID=A0A941IXC2_9BACT|nr:porin [Carboxylicivirga sediminis]MBR8536611.1 porin [Carboxylicivirga sediminis]
MKTILLILGLGLALTTANAQEETKNNLEITGSVDTYFKYDFAGQSNIPTSFADDHNSISIGMIDLGLSQTVGKATFVGELSFGPRSYKSIPSVGFLTTFGEVETQSVNIQNAYISYALSDAVSLTAGYMGTFVGYEVISPAANFNYSTSYLFSAGPFQNAGFKVDWSISESIALMLGVFNDWNVYQDMNGLSDFGGQLALSPVDGWDAYINFLTGPESGTIIDLTTGYQISDAFYLGLNAADYSVADKYGDAGYTGFALYPQYSFSDKVAIGYRAEYYKEKENNWLIDTESVFSNTITLNYYHGPFTLSSELRMDSAKDEIFLDNNDEITKSASQFLIAAIYSF